MVAKYSLKNELQGAFCGAHKLVHEGAGSLLAHETCVVGKDKLRALAHNRRSFKNAHGIVH